ncbi:MAG: type II toxin-antitoxin system RelE/ParE family toxin [Candidatus Sulfotelmatobacter sp.]
MVSKWFQFHPEAKEEFRSAVRWYRARNLLASSEFRLTVSSAIRLIAESSQRWPKYLHGTRRLVMRRFPFSVIYLDEPDLVIIVAVAHSKRRPGYWKDRV